MTDESLKYKIILAGEGAVGKTTLINRFVTGSFTTDYKATIGVAIFSKLLEIDGIEVSLQIWDIAGQTLFRNLRTRFFQNAKGALLVYDSTMPFTLANLHNWISDIKNVTDDIPFVLIGNKIDLTELRSITTEDVDNFIHEHQTDINTHFQTSALTGENVEEAFTELSRSMIL
ncbi:MAG: Rab family GTPase [Candidatus Hodarchaeales archaeon]|jgi:small GTP-binding protein